MKQTEKYKLYKPDYTDEADIGYINQNMDKLDAHSHSLADDDITGVLPITKGGTGAATAAAARTNLGLGAAATNGVSISVASSDTNLVTSGGVYNAIHSSVEITADTDLNDLALEGFYFCNSSNSESVTNKVDGVTFFSLRINKISGGVLSQELTAYENKKYIRINWSGGWTDWVKFTTADELNIAMNTLPIVNCTVQGGGNAESTKISIDIGSGHNLANGFRVCVYMSKNSVPLSTEDNAHKVMANGTTYNATVNNGIIIYGDIITLIYYDGSFFLTV